MTTSPYSSTSSPPPLGLPIHPVQRLVVDLRRVWESGSRRRRIEDLGSQGHAPLASLFYHRVSDRDVGPWTIRSEAFEQQIRYVADNFDVVSLQELQRRAVHQENANMAVAITFDDGYADNCEFALPLLRSLEIPITYFVTLDNIVNQTPFDHDAERGCTLAPNTIEQLRRMVDDGVSIGLHARTHINLEGVTDAEVLDREIVTAVAELSNLVSAPVKYFAVPFGFPAQLTQAMVDAVQRAGLHGFCSAMGGYNLPERSSEQPTDAFHIRRFHGDPAFCRVRNWLTFDQRKVSDEPQLDLVYDQEGLPEGWAQ